VYTFSLNREFTPTIGEKNSIYSKQANPLGITLPEVSGDVMATDRTNPNRVIVTNYSENKVNVYELLSGDPGFPLSDNFDGINFNSDIISGINWNTRWVLNEVYSGSGSSEIVSGKLRLTADGNLSSSGWKCGVDTSTIGSNDFYAETDVDVVQWGTNLGIFYSAAYWFCTIGGTNIYITLQRSNADIATQSIRVYEGTAQEQAAYPSNSVKLWIMRTGTELKLGYNSTTLRTTTCSGTLTYLGPWARGSTNNIIDQINDFDRILINDNSLGNGVGDPIYLSGSTYEFTNLFERTSEISGFGSSIDLSGDILVIGVPPFRSSTGKIEAWYYDTYVSGVTANTDYQGWNKVTMTNTEKYWGTNTGDEFGTSASLYDNYVYAHDTTDTSHEFNINYHGPLVLKRTATSNKVKLVETNDYCKVLETDTSNKYKIYDQRKDIWLGCIYGTEQFLQAQATANPSVYPAYSTDIQMRGATGPIDQITQLDNAALGFKVEDSEQVRYYNYATKTYTELPESIVVYEKPVSGYTETWFNGLSAPRAILSGINFAHMSEMPIDEVYYDFDAGEMYMDEFTMHNFMDYKYDVDATINDVLSGIHEVVQLSGTRYYDRIGTGTSIIWASYKTGQDYANADTVSLSVSGDQPLLIESVGFKSGGAYDYQYIEKIRGVNRSNTDEHKSNIYSIEIRNSNLNEAIEDDATRDLVHRIVERAVREFAEKAAPIHTQLWKIIWAGT